MKVEPAGLGYAAAIVSEGIAISVTHLRESRSELHGEMTVERAPEGHLMRERLNLTSSAARARSARYLAGRSGGVDWVGILEEFCLRALDQHRTGEPVERIGRRPRSADAPRLIDPLLPLGADVQLYGPQGSMKSTLARALAIEAATGSPIIPDTTCPRTVQVLVLDYETTSAEWNDGVARIADGYGITAPEDPLPSLPSPTPGDDRAARGAGRRRRCRPGHRGLADQGYRGRARRRRCRGLDSPALRGAPGTQDRPPGSSTTWPGATT